MPTFAYALNVISPVKVKVSSEIFVNIPNFKENVDKVIVDVNSDTAEEVYHGESRL